MSFGTPWPPRIAKRTSTVEGSWDLRIPAASAAKAIALATTATPRNIASRLRYRPPCLPIGLRSGRERPGLHRVTRLERAKPPVRAAARALCPHDPSQFQRSGLTVTPFRARGNRREGYLATPPLCPSTR